MMAVGSAPLRWLITTANNCCKRRVYGSAESPLKVASMSADENATVPMRMEASPQASGKARQSSNEYVQLLPELLLCVPTSRSAVAVGSAVCVAVAVSVGVLNP